MERTLAPAECCGTNGNAVLLQKIRDIAGSFSRLTLYNLRLAIDQETYHLPEDAFLMRVADQAVRQKETLEEKLQRTHEQQVRELIQKLLQMGSVLQDAANGDAQAHEVVHEKKSVTKKAAARSAANGHARNGMSTSPLLPLWQEFKADPSNQELRNKLIESYMHLAKLNAEKIWSRLPEGVELDDLVSAGIFGLMDAIDAFDLTRGVKFETYCAPRIRGSILDELRNMDWVPRIVRARASKIHEANRMLRNRLGREPSEDELASHMKIPLQKLIDMLHETNTVGVVSLEKKWYETDSYKDVREIDILEDKKAERPHRETDRLDALRIVLRGMDQRERLILISYYWEGMTMKEIGKSLDLTESRVSQMHSAMLERIETSLAVHVQKNDGTVDSLLPQFAARALLSHPVR